MLNNPSSFGFEDSMFWACSLEDFCQKYEQVRWNARMIGCSRAVSVNEGELLVHDQWNFDRVIFFRE